MEFSIYYENGSKAVIGSVPSAFAAIKASPLYGQRILKVECEEVDFYADCEPE